MSRYKKEDYIFSISDVRANNFKKLFEVLKEKFLEVRLFVKKEGILSCECESTELLHIRLNEQNFDEYLCNEEFVLYFEPANLFKVIKTINNDDTICLYVLKDNPKYLFIRAQSNVSSDQFEVSQFRLLESKEEHVYQEISEIPIIQAVSGLSSKKLNIICKNFNNVEAIYLEILLDNDFVQFGCFSTFLDKKEIYIGDLPEKFSDSVTKGIFNLNSIKTFAKGINASNTAESELKLCMGYNFLIIEYEISTLGKIQLILESISPREIFSREETFKYQPDWEYILRRMPIDENHPHEQEFIKKVIVECEKNASAKKKYKIESLTAFKKLVEKYCPQITT